MGRMARAPAIATLCFCPGERSSIRRPPISSRPSISRRRAHPLGDLLALKPQVFGAEGHVVYHAVHHELVVGVLEDDGDPAPHVPLVLLIHGHAVYTDIVPWSDTERR